VEEDEKPEEGEEPKPEGETKKKKKTVTEKYWDWELANETKPIWPGLPMRQQGDARCIERETFPSGSGRRMVMIWLSLSAPPRI
ncbi:hypothetical protein Taro_047501, partial [Colocasia esculenta]|nr:hypothetical protein [Colocasia esculenta]